MSEHKSVRVAGATGLFMDRVNGVFDPTGDYINNSPSYRHRQHKDVFFIFDKDRCKWKIRCSDLDGKTIAKFIWDEAQISTSVQNSFVASGVDLQWVVKVGIRIQKYASADIIMVVADDTN